MRRTYCVFSSNSSRCRRLSSQWQQRWNDNFGQRGQSSSSTSSSSDPTTITRICFHTRTTVLRRQPESSSQLVPSWEMNSQQQQQQQQQGLFVRRISTTTRRSFSSNHRSLSSVSAVAAVRQDEEDEEDVDDVDEDEQQQQHLRWPRLQALKQRLQEEGRSGHSSRRLGGKDSTISMKQSGSSSCSSSTTTASVVKIQHHIASQQQKQQQHEESASSSSSRNQLTITKSTDLESIDTMDLLRRLEEMDKNSHTDTANNNNQEQKLLQDSFGRQHDYLRISLTERCNLRCTYCMPEAGVPLQPAEHLLQTPELLQLASHFYHHLGVSKFRLTGGEPTLRKDLVQVVQGLSSLYYNEKNESSSSSRVKPQIGMTTNGIVLAKHLPALYEAGLTSVNVSLDTLDADKFAALTRRPAAYLDRVLEVIDILTTQEPYKSNITTKINCVVQRNVNDNELVDFVQHYCQDNNNDNARNLNAIRFIEYMPFTENGWDLKKLVPHQEMLQLLQQHHGDNNIIQALAPRDPHDTTKWYTTNSNSSSARTSATTKIGFITSMSNHFCAGCNRLRLTADGQLQVCLFGTNGRNGRVNLRDALRGAAAAGQEQVSPRQLNLLINYALSRKHYKLGGHDSPTDIMQRADTNNRPMTLIGG